MRDPSSSQDAGGALHASLQARMAAGARVKGPSGLPDLRIIDQALGCPGQGPFVVQVVGTNGKGSTTSMLAHLLGRAGLKVGWFSSPHIYRVNERIRVGQDTIGDADLYRLSEKVCAQESALGVELTFFELLTQIALLYFAESKVDVIVLEAGLGGRLDSTRVRLSNLTLITPIALDHQAILGPTLTHIAQEKAAVIHAKAPVYSAVQDPAAWGVIEAQARACGTELTKVAALERPWPGLHASYQQQNGALALAAAQAVLESCGHSREQASPNTFSQDSFRDWSWPGRMEIQPDPRGGGVVWDVAHNPHAVGALVHALKAQDRVMHSIYWFSAIDKDRSQILKQLATLNATLHELDLDAEGAQAQVTQAQAQLQRDLEAGAWILVVGSHRLVAALRPGAVQDGLLDPVQREPF